MESRGSACHSLVRPVPNPVSMLAALPAALARRSVPGFTRIWTVSSDDRRNGPRATRLRETERRRALAPGARLRCVLLEHVDGHELILVADRARFPLCCLNALAAVEDLAAHVASPTHGPAPEPTGSVRMVAAVGALYAALLRQDTVLVTLEEGGAAPVGFQVTATATTALPAPPDDPQIGVMVVTGASPDEYRPVLAACHPITVVAYVAADGPPETVCHIDERKVSRAVGDVLARQLPRRLAGCSEPFALERSEVADILRTGLGPASTAEPVSVPDAFATIVSAGAERVAVTGEGRGMTYAELDDASRAAASALVARGVEPGERVGVCMERSPRAIVALLAILRAGGCYVPLDRTLPATRLSYVIADAGLRLVVTDGDVGADGRHRDPLTGVAGVSLDELLSRNAAAPLPVVGPETPAYVIYTSGTTGDPKGVVIPHRNILALVAATRSAVDLRTSDVWTVFHSFAFDFSVWEIWCGLLTGGRLVMVPYWTARTPTAFARLAREEHVTVLSQTPSAFINLIPALLADGMLLDLRMVVFGGESLRPSTLIPWIRRVPPTVCRLVNMYGITETTVHVTYHDITAADVVADSHSVGRPLPGWSVSVRSPEGDVLPFGVAGEIWVGGAGLAAGYLERPELTAARFPVDPASGARHYRSGDLGRLNADGTLEHLGRIDDQVKIRGYRVELGEIRAALLDHSEVRDAVVTYRDTDDGGAVHAFAVTSGEVSPTALRRLLRTTLPDYMVPSVMRTVAALPLTNNGKVDLTALMAPQDSVAPEPPPVVADTVTSLEAVVQRVWVELFGEGSLEHDFFDLGGTSLQALKIANVLSGSGTRPLEPLDVYLNPTAADLVAFLERVD